MFPVDKQNSQHGIDNPGESTNWASLFPRPTIIRTQELHVRLAHIKIKNFRAHSNTQLPLAQLGCLIGENNAGKSSVLHAIRYVLEDKKIGAEDFRNPELPVSVELKLEGIDEEDLRRMDETHRDRVREMVQNGELTIVRTQ